MDGSAKKGPCANLGAPHPEKQFSDSNSGTFSCINVHRCVHRRTSLNDGKWTRKKVRARTQDPHLY